MPRIDLAPMLLNRRPTKARVSCAMIRQHIKYCFLFLPFSVRFVIFSFLPPSHDVFVVAFGDILHHRVAAFLPSFLSSFLTCTMHPCLLFVFVSLFLFLFYICLFSFACVGTVLRGKQARTTVGLRRRARLASGARGWK